MLYGILLERYCLRHRRISGSNIGLRKVMLGYKLLAMMGSYGGMRVTMGRASMARWVVLCISNQLQRLPAMRNEKAFRVQRHASLTRTLCSWCSSTFDVLRKSHSATPKKKIRSRPQVPLCPLFTPTNAQPIPRAKQNSKKHLRRGSNPQPLDDRVLKCGRSPTRYHCATETSKWKYETSDRIFKLLHIYHN
jgi:hypothetical protein